MEVQSLNHWTTREVLSPSLNSPESPYSLEVPLTGLWGAVVRLRSLASVLGGTVPFLPSFLLRKAFKTTIKGAVRLFPAEAETVPALLLRNKAFKDLGSKHSFLFPGLDFPS